MPKNYHPPRSKNPNVAESKPSSSAGSSQSKDPKKIQGSVTKDEEITTGKKNGSKGRSAGQSNELDQPTKKPDTRTLIAGSSWTGKLPVALLSEMCQKQKWNKPEYTMVR
jgi:ATP-dependent RNA helicase DHX57